MNLKNLISERSVSNVCIIIILTFILSSILIAQDEISLEQKKEMVTRLIEEAYNQRKYSSIDDLVLPDYVEYTNGIRVDSSSAIKKAIIWLAERAPNFKITPVSVIGVENTIVLQWVYQGLNTKYNKEVILHGIYIAKFRDNKIAEGWQYFDNHQRYQQLGFKIEVP